MRHYLNNSFLNYIKNNNMPIVKALIKYGQGNFAVLILEYVEPEVINIRETYWITKLLPYYNVLKQGYSSLGFKHTEDTKILLSELAKNRIHSDETKSLIAEALTGDKNPFSKKTHTKESKLKIIESKSRYPVYIFNSFKELLMIYPSVRTLAKVINANSTSINNFINNQYLFRGEWYFSSVPYNIADVPLILDYSSIKGDIIISQIKNSSHIRKAVFLFNVNKEFIRRYDGVIIASKELNISHEIIKKYALLNKPYKGYIFSYHRLLL